MKVKQVKQVQRYDAATEERLRKDPFITLWKNNYAENTAKGYLSDSRSRPLLFIKNTRPYANLPVVIVAAGPSLDKNIELLREYQNNCIVICADVIVFKLLQNGIQPDFVCNIDPHPNLKRFWNGINTEGMTLVCPTTTNPATLVTWKGKIYFFNQSDIDKSHKGEALKKLIKPTENWGVLFNRFFVGSTMFQFTEYLNPSVIILVGHDFCYTDDKAFCDGFLDIKIHHDENPVGSDEHTYMINKLKAEEIHKDLQVKISLTESVWTSNALNLYKNTLLGLIRKSRLHVINSTEGGIMTEVEKMSLKMSLEHFCNKPVTKIDTFSFNGRKRKKRR